MLSGIYNYIIIKLHNAIGKVNIIKLKDRSQIKGALLKGAILRGNIRVGEGVKIIDGVKISAGSPCILGRYTSLNGPNTDIQCKINTIEIGSFVSIARNVVLQEFNHRIDRPTTYFIKNNIFKTGSSEDIYSNGPITIGNDVWIGTHCVILSGATIGHGAIVAANSVVAGEIPPYAIVGGSPAKVLRYRFTPEIVAELLRIQWWNWPIEKIRSNEAFFDSTLTLRSFDNIIS